MEKQAPFGRAGVNIACQYLEHLFLLLEVVGGLNDLLKGSRQPREAPDHQGVAWAHVFDAALSSGRSRCAPDAFST